jgi:hypothetical protein
MAAPGALQLLPGGTLSGTGAVEGDVVGGGNLRPGNSPGILTITGNYTQTPTSVLEIEVGALTPGPGSPNVNAGHDQVRVGGVATLDGRYDFPIINGFSPQVNDEIVFIDTFDPDGAGPLPKGEIAVGTRPREAFAPGLEAANPNLAFRVISDTVLDQVRLRFVDKSEIFLDTNAASVPWFQDIRWTDPAAPLVDRNPDLADNTLVTNASGGAQTVTLNSIDPVTLQPIAEVRRLEVTDESFGITLAVDPGYKLNVTVGDAMIAARGAVELNSGVLQVPSTQAVKVVNGGLLAGEGSVVGDVVIGATGLAGSRFSPGMEGALPDVGAFSVTRSVTQGAAGVLDIDITGAASPTNANNDYVYVGEQLNLGGQLTIDVSGLNISNFTPGAEYTIANAASVAGAFSSIETVGRNDIYFAVVEELAPASAGELDDLGQLPANSLVPRELLKLEGRLKGNIVGSQQIDEEDAAVLSRVLILGVDGIYGPDSVPLDDGEVYSAFDFIDTTPTNLRNVDFRDVPYFAAAMARSQGMSYAMALESFGQVFDQVYAATVPEPSAATLVGVLAALGFHRQRSGPQEARG